MHLTLVCEVIRYRLVQVRQNLKKVVFDDVCPWSAQVCGRCHSSTKMPTFERVLWRACRGNVFLRYQDISVPLKDPATVNWVFVNRATASTNLSSKTSLSLVAVTGVWYNANSYWIDIVLFNWECQSLCCQGDEINKAVFIIFFQGKHLKTRVNKICEGYGKSFWVSLAFQLWMLNCIGLQKLIGDTRQFP